jgi:hypothetical protein
MFADCRCHIVWVRGVALTGILRNTAAAIEAVHVPQMRVRILRYITAAGSIPCSWRYPNRHHLFRYLSVLPSHSIIIIFVVLSNAGHNLNPTSLPCLSSWTKMQFGTWDFAEVESVER